MAIMVEVNGYTFRGSNSTSFIFSSLLKEITFKRKSDFTPLTLLHSDRPKLYTILAFLSAVGLRGNSFLYEYTPLFP